ncbi:MAG: hypothetical protein ABIS18_08065 [Actinomycetota bacterium]
MAIIAPVTLPAQISRPNRNVLLFVVLIAAQGAHIVEHIVQLVQLFVLHLGKARSHGIVGQLDIEWVHFIWNLGVFLAAVMLVRRYPGNPWLMVVLVLASWHQIEHSYIMFIYLTTGVAGTPGLLASGGKLWGGLPVSRPVLHAIYNVAEFAPLVGGFLYERRR